MVMVRTDPRSQTLRRTSSLMVTCVPLKLELLRAVIIVSVSAVHSVGGGNGCCGDAGEAVGGNAPGAKPLELAIISFWMLATCAGARMMVDSC